MTMPVAPALILCDDTSPLQACKGSHDLSLPCLVLPLDHPVSAADLPPDGFSLLLCDLADARPPDQAALLSLLHLRQCDKAAVIVLYRKEARRHLAPAIREKAHLLLPRPLATERLMAIVHFYRHRTLGQHQKIEDLQSCLAGFDLVEKSRFLFSTLEQAKSLALLLATQCPRRMDAEMGLLELLVNAVEHGNLGISFDEKSRLLREGRWHQEIRDRLSLPRYAGRTASVLMERLSDRIEFHIADEGDGFDIDHHLNDKITDRTRPSGRGIQLARDLYFDRLEYLGSGNRVRATMYLQGCPEC
ncbi:ATP-binding protein [Sneathiella chinensis]|uniref:Histidine kinase/HSP90-like ATPase domain-containing protein n=1 Tax=Sneathiella chinensis TaxID=349750 RepID=A0ABQ5U540_9PROT|nr:ATP-binding protein [Sneathiella chinensis]GLQ06953.1 hypothetical protein GCM10007924_21740 [Sneathiella chinensis]